MSPLYVGKIKRGQSQVHPAFSLLTWRKGLCGCECHVQSRTVRQAADGHRGIGTVTREPFWTIGRLL